MSESNYVAHDEEIVVHMVTPGGMHFRFGYANLPQQFCMIAEKNLTNAARWLAIKTGCTCTIVREEKATMRVEDLPAENIQEEYVVQIEKLSE